MPLTARAVETAKPIDGKRRELADGVIPGLSLRIAASGAKTWSLHYRTPSGTRRRFTLGHGKPLGLKEARTAAQLALREVAAGKDPAAEKVAARQGETLADLAAEYLTKHAKRHKKSWRDDDRMITAELSAWKHRKVTDLTRRDVRDLVEKIAERGSPITANRCLALIRKMLNFAIGQDWIEANVASLIQKPGTERSRDRVLTDDEIRRVWIACDGERAPLAALMKLRLVTAQRGGELAQIRWSDIEGEWLTLRPEITKNKRAHRVYLTPKALELLTAMPKLSETIVFPGRFLKQPLGDSKQAGRRIAARVEAALREIDPDVRFDFRGHDLRRTAATRMAEAGVSQTDIARVLNHVEGGPRATQVYNRYDGDREKRIALETWERVLVGILSGDERNQVVPITRTKRHRG